MTARFTIPNVYITSQARQAGQPRDLYAEPIDINERLEIVKGEKVVHGLRPVDAYALDADGTSSVDFENRIRTSSHWILNENSAGQADISMSIDDLFKQTEGRIVLDPSTDFQEGVSGYTGCQDSFLYINEYETPDRTDYNYGASTTLALWAVKPPGGNHSETRPIIRFTDMDTISGLGKGLIVTDATMEFKLCSRTLSYGSSPPAEYWVQPYGITPQGSQWAEGSGNHQQASTGEVTWNSERHDCSEPWIEAGASAIGCVSDRIGAVGGAVNIAWISTSGTWVKWPIHPQYAQSWLEDSLYDQNTAGFILEVTNKETSYTNVLQYSWYSRNHATPANRPKLSIEYRKNMTIGIDAGNGWGTLGEIDARQEAVKADKMNMLRYFCEHDTDKNQNYMSKADENDMKVIIVFPCGPVRSSITTDPLKDFPLLYNMWYLQGDSYDRSPSGYKDYIMDRLNALDSYVGDTIIGVEIGNEEECGFETKINNVTASVSHWPTSAMSAIGDL